MIRLDDRQAIPAELRGGIIALGNFDGFHRGHQAVVGHAVSWARAQNVPAIVATFDPHPMRFFKPDTPPFYLTTLNQRQDLFAKAGADAMLVLNFTAEMAAMSPQEWISSLLQRHMGAAGVVTGRDFTFGHNRAGDIHTLAELGARDQIEARSVGPVIDDERAVSSSRIRKALAAGQCDLANRMLTRPFSVRAIVEHGSKLGRTIGFPTANLRLGTYQRPKYGVYAVTATLADGQTLQGAASIGIRPTFTPPVELLEPYFFDFSGDLYGQEIEVAFHHYLRPEAKFDNLANLTSQIEQDCSEARKLLDKRPS